MKTIKKKVVIFDFDGTIVNSMETFADIAAHVMPKHLPIDTKTARRRYLETSGIPFFEQLEEIFADNPANKKTSDEFETKKAQGYLESPVFKDAAATITSLKQRGIKVIVSSNNFQDLVDRLVSQNAIQCDMVLGFKENFAKGPDHFKHIIKKTGCGKNEILFVGDSLKDGERAHDFGIDFVGKEGTFTRSDFNRHFPKAKVISNLSELMEII